MCLSPEVLGDGTWLTFVSSLVEWPWIDEESMRGQEGWLLWRWMRLGHGLQGRGEVELLGKEARVMVGG